MRIAKRLNRLTLTRLMLLLTFVVAITAFFGVIRDSVPKAHAAGRILSSDPCAWYIIPPPECDQTPGGGGDYDLDEYYDEESFPYPQRFLFWGMVGGTPILGYAIRHGTTNTYFGSFAAAGGGGSCFGNVTVQLTMMEGAYISMGWATTLSNTYVWGASESC